MHVPAIEHSFVLATLASNADRTPTGMVEAGFEIMLTSVSCEGLDHSWLGHVLTKSSLKHLHELSNKHRFNVDGEGGEYETYVLGGPIWSRSMEVEGEEHHTASRGVYIIHSVV